MDLAHQADEALSRGDVALAHDLELRVAKCFVVAASETTDTVTATSLVLLAQSHARKAMQLDGFISRGAGEGRAAAAGGAAEVTPRGPGGAMRAALSAGAVGAVGSGSGDATSGEGPADANANALPFAIPEDDAEEGAASLPAASAQRLSRGVVHNWESMLQLSEELEFLGLGAPAREASAAAREAAAAISANPMANSVRYLSSTLGESFCLLRDDKRSSAIGNLPPLPSSFHSDLHRSLSHGSLSHGPAASSVVRSLSPPPPAPAAGARARMDQSAVLVERLGANVYQAAEVDRLVRSMHRLSEENDRLMREVEALRREGQRAEQAREGMRRFKGEYEARFKRLKNSLEEFGRRYPEVEKLAAKEDASRVSSSFMASKPDHRELKELRDRLQRRDYALRKYHAHCKKLEAFVKALKTDPRRLSARTGAAKKPQMPHAPAPAPNAAAAHARGKPPLCDL